MPVRVVVEWRCAIFVEAIMEMADLPVGKIPEAFEWLGESPCTALVGQAGSSFMASIS